MFKLITKRKIWLKFLSCSLAGVVSKFACLYLVYLLCNSIGQRLLLPVERFYIIFAVVFYFLGDYSMKMYCSLFSEELKDD
jgi:hypothetical protein